MKSIDTQATATQTAFVTGGASGIGLATVETLAKAGFHVVAIDRNAQAVQQATDQLRARDLLVDGAVADVCDRQAVGEILERQARVDVMVCAAGIYAARTFDEITDDDFRRTLEVNLLGVFIAAQEASRRMPAGGRIVTVSSRGALGGKGFADYVASKAGVIGLTRAMAMELKDRQIAVNSIAPGFTDTPMTRSMPPDLYAAAIALEQSGAAASPYDIAEAIAFFAAPTTRFITGQTLFVDGGKSLGGLGV
ncbi:SDR family NAD(P)-dependent oxidoreductase [Paraburkholderia domus]|uniref:SDR family NAD(P)-dependent oxidoreductase n=1 Tax=Paraburkholderia domus TaxID=2793075 RepID=UPI001912FB88|nr:SDR family NAD(P)-dependent oxidoreductase [Paraburkholderia domus]MBK5065994.1 SDR family oxidoreductase [Burkholderia sp. R-70199]CAE6965044.1 3-oxoacyl-[acyl-carrier-protein] reductase FabG [Paraburkholderia domus]